MIGLALLAAAAAAFMVFALTHCSGSRAGTFAIGGVDDDADIADANLGDEALKLYFDSSAFDAFPDDEAEADTIVDDGWNEAPTTVDAMIVNDASDAAAACTPIAESSQPCGASMTITSPKEYCVQNQTGGHHDYAVTMPNACQCAETFGCACLAAQTSNLCNGFGSYDGSFGGCNDTLGYVLVNCP
jgi:hypothetical protein